MAERCKCPVSEKEKKFRVKLCLLEELRRLECRIEHFLESDDVNTLRLALVGVQMFVRQLIYYLEGVCGEGGKGKA